MKTLRGIGVSSGYAVGKAIVIKEIERDLNSAVYTTAEEEIKKISRCCFGLYQKHKKTY